MGLVRVEFKRTAKNNREHLQTAATRGDTFRAEETRPAQPTEKTINIRINFNALPKLPTKTLIISRLRWLYSSKKAIAITAATVIVSLFLVGSLAGQYNTAAEPDKSGGADSLVENLEYQTVLPEGKSISELGGWKRVSPSKSDPVYAYVDSIDNVSISVSQQPLPQSFKSSIDDQVAELAKKFNATTKLDTGNTKVYVGTSAKGPQSAILTKNGLLILIKSQQKISDKSWTKYVAALN